MRSDNKIRPERLSRSTALLAATSPMLGKIGLFSCILILLASCGDSYKPPAPVEKFDVHVTLMGVRRPTPQPRVAFRVSSGQLNVGCGDTVGTSARWPLPVGASEVQTIASWQHTDNLKTYTQQADVEGDSAVAKGSITGRDKEMFNCPGGGHGELVLEGSYQAAPSSSGPEVIKVVHDELAIGQQLLVSVPIDKTITPTSGDLKAVAKSGTVQAKISFAFDTQGKLQISGIEPAGGRVQASLKENILTVAIQKQ